MAWARELELTGREGPEIKLRTHILVKTDKWAKHRLVNTLWSLLIIVTNRWQWVIRGWGRITATGVTNALRVQLLQKGACTEEGNGLCVLWIDLIFSKACELLMHTFEEEHWPLERYQRMNFWVAEMPGTISKEESSETRGDIYLARKNKVSFTT